MVKVGVNGFGRIGRNVVRAALEKKYDIERHIARVLDVVHLHAPLEKKIAAFSGGHSAAARL